MYLCSSSVELLISCSCACHQYDRSQCDVQGSFSLEADWPICRHSLTPTVEAAASAALPSCPGAGMHANVGEERQLSPLLSHLLPAVDSGHRGSSAQTPNMYPPVADFYSGCVSISPAPAPGLLPLPQGPHAPTHHDHQGSGSPAGTKAHEPLHSSQPMLSQMYAGNRWDGADSSGSVYPPYCISETTSNAPASMHGSIHARPHAWQPDRSRKGEAKFHGKGATDMRRCVPLPVVPHVRWCDALHREVYPQ